MQRLERRTWPRALTVLAAAVSIPAASWAQPPDTTPDAAFVLSSGIIVEADGSELFLMRPEGGVEAVDVALGRTLWTSAAAARPLAVRGNLLLAQTESPGRASTVGLALIDSNRGALRRETRLDLPEELWTGIDDGLGAAFAVEAWSQGNDLLLAWSCQEEDVGGAAIDRRPARGARGAARIDTASGRVERLEPGAVTPPLRPPLSVPAQGLVAAQEGRQFFSADGRHVLVSERVADDRVWEKYRWTLFDHGSGERLGQIASRWSRTEFFVAGTTLVQLVPAYQRRLADGRLEEAPRRVRALDLASGAELWQRPIRDTAYRGPFPP